MKIDFDDLYERFFKDVYLFVLAMSKDPHIAEEITQETFFKALKEAKNFRGNCSVKTWLRSPGRYAGRFGRGGYLYPKRRSPLHL